MQLVIFERKLGVIVCYEVSYEVRRASAFLEKRLIKAKVNPAAIYRRISKLSEEF